jgi:hypothetical protein
MPVSWDPDTDPDAGLVAVHPAPSPVVE